MRAINNSVYSYEVKKQIEEEYKKENYFANNVLGTIENVKVPMLMNEGEKEVVKKALNMYKDYLEIEIQNLRQEYISSLTFKDESEDKE